MLTFAGFPYSPYQKELQAEIALIGIPYGTPYDAGKPPHSLNAPATIRRESVRFKDDPRAWDFDLGGVLMPDKKIRVVDCGDLSGSQADPFGNRDAARSAIQNILSAGAIPVVFGGDDSIPIPVMQAYEGQEPFYVLQLDAHIDWRDTVDDIREGYSSTMRRASELPWVRGIIQAGMRGVGSAREEEFLAALKFGANLITAAEIRANGIGAVLEQVPQACQCFLTIDLDALDPSVMPAVGAPTPGGLAYADVVDLIQAVTMKARIVGFCMVELVPESDVNTLGAITAMRIAWNMIGTIARNLQND